MNLEKQILRTYGKIIRTMESKPTPENEIRFYSLVRHYEKLNARYAKLRGYSFNPLL
jgi:hypothetical protein